MLFGMDIPLFRPGFRMVIFSVLLMVRTVLAPRHYGHAGIFLAESH